MNRDILAISDKYNKMDKVRLSRLGLIDSLAKYLEPENSPYEIDLTGNLTLERFIELIENLPQWALDIAVSGVYSAIMPVGRKWFRLESIDADLNTYQLAKDIEDFTYRQVENEFFGGFILKNLYEMFIYGNCVNQKTINKDGTVELNTLPQGSYSISVDKRNEIDAIALEYKCSVYEFEENFGFIPHECKNKNKFDEVRYRQFACKNIYRQKDDKGVIKDWVEYYFYDNGKGAVVPLKIIGYKDSPYLAARFKKANSGYGIGAAIKSLGAIVSLEDILKDFLNALGEQFDPAIIVNKRTLSRPNFSKGKVSFADIDSGGMKSPEAYNARKIEYDWAAFQLAYQIFSKIIERALNADIFTSVAGAGKQMTAYETAVLQEEKVLRFGNLDAEIKKELIQPFIETQINSYYEINNVKNRQKLKIKYYGYSYDALRQAELNKYGQALQMLTYIGQTAQFSGVNVDKAERYVFESLGLSMSTLLTAAQKEAIAQAAMVQQLAAQADIERTYNGGRQDLQSGRNLQTQSAAQEYLGGAV